MFQKALTAPASLFGDVLPAAVSLSFPSLRLVAHVFNHMSGVTQSAGNIIHQTGNSIRELGIFTQIPFGRTGHV